MSDSGAVSNEAAVEHSRNGTELLTVLARGRWSLQRGYPSVDLVSQWLDESPVKRVYLDASAVSHWDTSLLVFSTKLKRLCDERRITLDNSGLPEGAQRLLRLAAMAPAAADSERPHETDNLLSDIGRSTIDLVYGTPRMLHFVGEVLLSFARFVRGKAQYRPSDLFLIIEQVGPKALPIVTLISFLTGLIMAYMGAVQLQRFGAQIYIADLVGIGMVREISALMTGIIVAGRTGAAFAAELGTMQVNEEIDAYHSLGISPIDFLVLPRMLALLIMFPFLTLYSGVVGILAGLTIAVVVFDISTFEYYHQTLRALDLTQFWVGLFKGTVYGALVALSGCLRGMQSGRSALAVGQATTSAVVTSIVFIVIAASLLTIVFHKLDI